MLSGRTPGGKEHLMKRRSTTRLLSLLLAVVMLFSLLSVMTFAEEETTPEQAEQTDASAPGEETAAAEEESPAQALAAGAEAQSAAVADYSVFLADLETLESYADAYVREHAGEDPVALVINFIRTGVEKYTDGSWTTLCGEEVKDFTLFVSEQDAAHETHAMDLRTLDEFTLPNGNAVEFDHMFGCMDMSYHTGVRENADLGSWIGDLCDLVELATIRGVSGTPDEMLEEIRSRSDLFLYDDPANHSFGQKDLYADLDAFYILSRLNGTNKISQIMRSYYTAQLSDSFRVAYFLENRLGGAKTRADIRMLTHEAYLSNNGVMLLEGGRIQGGANPDRRQACCYALADYFYETALEYLTNDLYTPFSTERSVLAPGVTQEIKLAKTQDNQQIAYYLATADITRGDVQVFANYADNTGAKWQMQRVTDQMAAATAKHTDPNDPEHYIENYNAVVGVNGDFYNMGTGKPAGPLVMESTVWNEAPTTGSYSGRYFFAILNDGTPVIDVNTNWSKYAGSIKEAVGGRELLVKDGKACGKNDDLRASRTAVGITYDGRVVLMVLDGRQLPWSCGGSIEEISQIMLDAGCVIAMNLDGGGSTTFVAKPEGSDTPKVVSRPSDGEARSVSSSLMIVSTAMPSNVFDHAVVTADYDYLTVGTELEVSARGVTATGGAIDLPEGASLQLSDDSIGTLDDDVFTAAELGDVQVQVVSAEGEILGAKTLHVVEPTDLKFTSETMNVVFGEPKTLPLEATYNNHEVKINPDDVFFGYLKTELVEYAQYEGDAFNLSVTEFLLAEDFEEAGTIEGFDFTGDADSGLRTLPVCAFLTCQIDAIDEAAGTAWEETYEQVLDETGNDDKATSAANEAETAAMLEFAARIQLYLYGADEASFDFNDMTGGDGLLNYKREVSNSNYHPDENAYYVIDPNQDMVTSYVYAVDMSQMPMPEQFADLLYMLPGGTQEGRSAWSFLLQLAERISSLTTVTVQIELPEGFDVDITDLKLVNEYFKLESKTVEGNTLTITASFREQSQPINPTTANPLCVLSGLKLTPTDAAAWNADRSLDVHLSGKLTYDIYAHFHILETKASDPDFQRQYGLYPYSNRENDPNDYGGHFSSENDPITFSDDYRLVASVKSGWVREDGAWKYYDSGNLLTGPQYLPSYDSSEDGEFWFDLGEDGASKGKYTGFAQRDGKWYYPMDGVPAVGWFELADGNYCFRKDGSAQTEPLTVGPATYEFDDHGKVLHGCWVTTAEGTRYYYANNKYYSVGGGGATVRFVEIDGKTYGFGRGGYRYEGGYMFCRESNNAYQLYYFEDDGVCLGLQDQIAGMVTLLDGRIAWAENAEPVYKGVYAEFYDADGNRVDSVYDAARAEYMYFGVDGYAVVDKDAKISKHNSLLKRATTYHFDANGKYIVDLTGVKNGIFDEDGEKYFYLLGERYNMGLFEYKDGFLYHAGTDGKLAVAKRYYVYLPNTDQTGMPVSYYYFDVDGRLFVPDISFRAVNNTTGALIEDNCTGLKLSYGFATADPAAPSYLGYELVGWKVTGTNGVQARVKLVDGVLNMDNCNVSINEAIYRSGFTRDTAVTVTALYEKVADTYTATVSYKLPDGTVAATYQSDPFLVGSAMQIGAPETYSANGQVWHFDHWVVAGETYRTPTITLRPSAGGDYAVEAVYAAESSAMQPELKIVDAFKETVNGVNKLGVTTSWSVPEGWQVEQVGFRVSRTDPTLQNNFSMATSKLKTDTGTYTVHVKVAGKEDAEVYVCAYLIVTNTATGEQQTIFTDPVRTYIWSQM